MPRKITYEQALVAHSWVALDPADNAVIEKLFKKNIREGEERLMFSVLESAVEDFQKYLLARKPSGKKLFQEAEEWFLEKDNDGLFSFEYICDTLQFHPDYIRQGLLRWKEAKLNSRGAEPHPASRAKLGRSRIAHTSVRFSKTG
jgi:hypothetical protein